MDDKIREFFKKSLDESINDIQTNMEINEWLMNPKTKELFINLMIGCFHRGEVSGVETCIVANEKIIELIKKDIEKGG